MADKIKHVFISHIHEDDDGLGKLKDLVSNAGLTIRDSSINSRNHKSCQSSRLHQVGDPCSTDSLGKHAAGLRHTRN